MLSFFRRKSVGATTTKDGFRSPSKSSSMNSEEEVVPIGEEALLNELGYKDTNDLKETIYGKFFKDQTHILFFPRASQEQ